MKKRYKALLGLAVIFIGIPFILWLAWLLTTPKPISIFIMDKTSYTEYKIRHRAINWVLKHYRFVKPNGKDYSPDIDYYGFYPDNETNYTIRDLTGLNPLEISRLSIQYHAAYYVDSYGVYSNMYPVENADDGAIEKLYGGLAREDLLFLENMLRADKLIMAEFIFLAPPTQLAERKRAEQLLGIEWQGWTGRFFHTLDKDHPDGFLPGWIPDLYEAQYGEPWAFSRAGVIFVHEDQTLVVLEEDFHLSSALPHIHTDTDMRKRFGVSEKISYPGWFDITLPVSETARALSWYEFDFTPAGEALLKQHQIPLRFPAVLFDESPKRMYYFAGDFGHNPVSRRFIRFKGAKYAELFLADLNDPTDKSGFFLAYYLPLVKSIMGNYQDEIAAF